MFSINFGCAYEEKFDTFIMESMREEETRMNDNEFEMKVTSLISAVIFDGCIPIFLYLEIPTRLASSSSGVEVD